MTVTIYYKNNSSKKISPNLVLFVDEKFNISSLKKHISRSDYPLILELIKNRDIKKKIVAFDISSKKKIILVSLKNDITNSDAEKLGAIFYDKFKDNQLNDYSLNSDTLTAQKKKIVG